MVGNITLFIVLGVVIFLLIYVNYKNPKQYPIKLGKSPIHGRGVFATEDINSDEVIEVAPLVFFDRDEVRNGSRIRDYDIAHINGKNAIMLGYASIYNHADDSNAFWTFNDSDEIVIKCKKFIRKNEEIFVNYGPAYWNGERASHKVT